MSEIPQPELEKIRMQFSDSDGPEAEGIFMAEDNRAYHDGIYSSEIHIWVHGSTKKEKGSKHRKRRVVHAQRLEPIPVPVPVRD